MNQVARIVGAGGATFFVDSQMFCGHDRLDFVKGALA